jgi:hypothetical protein
MYPVAVVLQYTIQYNTIHKKTKKNTKQHIHTQNNTQRNNYKHNNTKLQTQCTKENVSIKNFIDRLSKTRSNIKFQRNPCSGSQVFPYGQTDDEVTQSLFANAPNNFSLLQSLYDITHWRRHKIYSIQKWYALDRWATRRLAPQ